jgi:hypothetical protein
LPLDVNAATAYQLAHLEGPQMSDVNKAALSYLAASNATAIRAGSVNTTWK